MCWILAVLGFLVGSEGLGNYVLYGDQRAGRSPLQDYPNLNGHSRPIQRYIVGPGSSSFDYHSKDNHLELGMNGNYFPKDYGRFCFFMLTV